MDLAAYERDKRCTGLLGWHRGECYDRACLPTAAAQAAFSGFLADRSLTPPQMRFIEMVIDQLTARGVMDAAALYEAPFSNLHAGGPDELFAGKENIISGIFDTLEATQPMAQEGRG